jgi:hypothetical protein
MAHSANGNWHYDDATWRCRPRRPEVPHFAAVISMWGMTPKCRTGTGVNNARVQTVGGLWQSKLAIQWVTLARPSSTPWTKRPVQEGQIEPERRAG